MSGDGRVEKRILELDHKEEESMEEILRQFLRLFFPGYTIVNIKKVTHSHPFPHFSYSWHQVFRGRPRCSPPSYIHYCHSSHSTNECPSRHKIWDRIYHRIENTHPSQHHFLDCTHIQYSCTSIHSYLSPTCTYFHKTHPKIYSQLPESTHATTSLFPRCALAPSTPTTSFKCTTGIRGKGSHIINFLGALSSHELRSSSSSMGPLTSTHWVGRTNHRQ